MSKNIVIQEGGIGKQLTVDKLKTGLVGGGTCLWVPEDDTRLGTKYISENGTYIASSDGLYGYSEVTVSGVGTASGKDPDGSGDDATATVDPETGEIVITKQPSVIKVITPPTNPYGTYTDGQTITKDGMVVKGYLATGGEWGTVPTADITINPTTAVYDQSTDNMEHTIDDSVLEHPEYMSLPLASVLTAKFGIEPTDSFLSEYEMTNCDYMLVFKTTGLAVDSYRIIAFSEQPNSGELIEQIYERRRDPITKEYYYVPYRTDKYSASSPVTTRVSGKIVYYADDSSPRVPNGTPINTLTGSKLDFHDIATVLYDGEHSGRGSHQQIAVTWPRPGDGAILETSFGILVGPRSGQGDD